MLQRYFAIPNIKLLILVVGSFLSHSAHSLNILTSIKPIHSLTQSITENISNTELLIHGFQSPHDYYLKPSDRRKINQADVIIFASENIESFMPEISETSKPGPLIINLSQLETIQLLEGRSQRSGHDHDHHTVDGHIWLSLSNAEKMIQHLTKLFAQLDPVNSSRYQSNAEKTLSRLQRTRQRIQAQLDRKNKARYLMFHDAFQYFEHDFGLQSAEYVTTSPEHVRGIRHVRYLKQYIENNAIQCIFYEPPEIPPLLHTLIGDHEIKILPLDPTGSYLEPGPELYFQLIEDIADKLHQCQIN